MITKGQSKLKPKLIITEKEQCKFKPNIIKSSKEKREFKKLKPQLENMYKNGFEFPSAFNCGDLYDDKKRTAEIQMLACLSYFSLLDKYRILTFATQAESKYYQNCFNELEKFAYKQKIEDLEAITTLVGNLKPSQERIAKTKLRSTAKTKAIQRKKELINKGYSATKANAIVQCEFEKIAEFRELFFVRKKGKSAEPWGTANWKKFLQG